MMAVAENPGVAVEDICRIRPAVPQDVPGIRWLIQLLAEYEKEPRAMKITDEELLRDGFSDDKFFHCLVAELTSDPVAVAGNEKACEDAGGEEELPSRRMANNERLVGYALYFYTYSTWEGRVLYLEDLFVRMEYRNRGIGSHMMRECAKIAVSKQCVRMQWQVLDWNTKAQQLYERMGGKCLPEWLTIRMSRDALAQFASAQSESNDSCSS